MAKREPQHDVLLASIGDVIDSLSCFRHAYREVHGTECEPAAMLEMVRVLSWAAIATMKLFDPNATDPRTGGGELLDEIHAAIREGLTT